MLLENQNIKAKWSKQNKKYYVEKGYDFTEYGDEFNVKAEDITHGSHVEVGFICDVCGDVHYIPINSHYRKHDESTFNNYICPKCYPYYSGKYSLDSRQTQAYKKIIDHCNKYGYITDFKKEDYLNSDTIVNYICPKHGKKSKRALLFMYGNHICPDCAYELNSLSKDEIEEKILEKGSVLLNKDDYKTTSTKNLKIKCKCCGDIFLTSFNSFICTRSGDAQYCPHCSKSMSAGEIKIKNYLEKNNIDYSYQKTFSDCKDKNVLPFDFFLPLKNTIIEYDGEQHFYNVNFSGKNENNLQYVQSHDKIKNKYCIDNKINLIRIPYLEYNKIEEILNERLQIT